MTTLQTPAVTVAGAPAVAAAHPVPVLAKPRWRGWMHLVWFEASLIVGTLLIATASGPHRGAVSVYAISVSAMFGASAMYHRGSWNPRLFRFWQRVDHTMIFVLIGGTATPVFLIAVGGQLGAVELAVMWALIAVALLVRLVWTEAPEVLVGFTYIGLGCLGAAALPSIWMHAGVGAFALILGGGLLYIAGAVLYLRRWPDPSPAYFGYHEVFHVFVTAAATIQYLAIAMCLI